MLNGQAIGSQAIGEAARRRLASEYGGARPDGVRGDMAVQAADDLTMPATRP